MAKPVEFHEEASAELEAAFDWYFARNERIAVDFSNEVNRAIGVIAENPHRWPVGLRNTRRYLLQRFPFAIVYRELPSVIRVLAVAHGAGEPGTGRRAPRVEALML